METIKTDICVIGAGSGGLSVAAGAAQMGAKTVLIEKGKMGGDCLNYGCVPSKSLLAAAKRAQSFRSGEAFGIKAQEPVVDFAQVHAHVESVIAAIAPNDSVERFEGLGVKVIQAAARFTGPRTLEAGGYEITARRFVIATGSRAAVPPIPGLGDVSYLTNETLFELTECPTHLLIIGGGPIGMEMAQAHKRLGAEVTVIEAGKALGKEDPEFAGIALTALRREGVTIHEERGAEKVEKTASGIAVTLAGGERVEGSHLLVAAGRTPNLEELGLEEAGVDYERSGITVDARLRSSNKKIFAIGDAAGGPQFTHVAGYHAGIVIRNALFRLPAKADHTSIPRVTYTDPEIAHVGETEEEARARYGRVEVLRWPFAENDRAQAEKQIEGMAKIVTDSHGRILGASIVGAHAGELLQPLVLAKANGLKVSALASAVVPYPTLTEVSKRAAGSYYTPTLYSMKTRLLVRFLRLFG